MVRGSSLTHLFKRSTRITRLHPARYPIVLDCSPSAPSLASTFGARCAKSLALKPGQISSTIWACNSASVKIRASRDWVPHFVNSARVSYHDSAVIARVNREILTHRFLSHNEILCIESNHALCHCHLILSTIFVSLPLIKHQASP